MLIVDDLEVVEIQQNERERRRRPAGTRQFSRDLKLQCPRVRQPGQRVFERLFLGALEQQRVVHSCRRLAGHLIEHATVVVRVRLARRGNTAMVPITSSADHQGTYQRRLELNVGRQHPCAVELRRRQPVDERPAMPRYPSAQTVAFRKRRILEQVGVQTGREPAAQVFVSAPDEQRTRGERHERTELRTDQTSSFP